MSGELYYSATIITLTVDGTDDIEQCGHWNPTRSYWTVWPSRDQVQPDRYPGRGRRTQAQWLAGRIIARLGSIDDWDGATTFTSARSAIHPGRLTGAASHTPGLLCGSGTFLGDAIAAETLRRAAPGTRILTAAAHAHGFTQADLHEAARLLTTT
jgi:hypothetical protein